MYILINFLDALLIFSVNFISSPVSKSELEEIKPLTKDLLMDLGAFWFDNSGKIMEQY